MKIELTLALLLMVGGATYQSTDEQDDPREKWGDNPMENPEFMAAMMKSMTPTAAHEEIAKGIGSWDIESKMFMTPGAEPMISKASAESRMVLGGRYLLQNYHGEAMGMPFEGMLLLGYNNLTEEYFSIWMDTWSTWPSLTSGKKNEKGEIDLAGEMRDVLTPGGRPFRHVTSFPSDDEQVARMYDTLPDGTEWMVMEMIYHRRE